jgi:hypothetical protein
MLKNYVKKQQQKKTTTGTRNMRKRTGTAWWGLGMSIVGIEISAESTRTPYREQKASSDQIRQGPR